MTESNQNQEPEQTLVDHLSDLRTCLIRSVIAVIIGTALSWMFSEKIFDFVRAPIQSFLPEGGLIFTAPMDKFLAHLKVSMLSGVIFSCPIWLFQVWGFVAPGLYKNEKKYGLSFILFGSLLFLIGVSFVYFVVYPNAFEFLLNFGGTADKAMITISDYLSFFTLTTLMFGFAFELPLILTILGMMGIVDSVFLKKHRRYAILILAVLSAFITPPDIVSMLCLIVPLIGLYELSIVLVKVFGDSKE